MIYLILSLEIILSIFLIFNNDSLLEFVIEFMAINVVFVLTFVAFAIFYNAYLYLQSLK